MTTYADPDDNYCETFGHTRILWIGDVFYPHCPVCGEEVEQ